MLFLEVSDNFSQEIPILKFPFSGIPGVGLEVGVGLGLFVEGDTKVSFDMQDGKTGFGLQSRAFLHAEVQQPIAKTPAECGRNHCQWQL